MRIRRIPRQVDSQLSWLYQMGLSRQEVEDLDLRQPMLQEVTEYAGVRRGQRLTPADIVRLLEATAKVLQDHMRDIDSQIWMLQHRKNSLQRKTAAVERVLRLLSPLPPRRVA